MQRRYHLGTEIKAEVEFYYYAKNPEQAKLIEQAFIAPEMITVGNKIIAEWRDNQIFSPKVPFNAIEVYLDFSVPENAKLKSDYRRCRQDHGIWEGGKFVCPEETRES
ncbi:MAG: hypothetical protein LBD11_02350 [Candidatus Peribacteria bacterium]|nr:hypothetical protein [Candidatus Peribacteria bacterium]